jgi:hypothetical protein
MCLLAGLVLAAQPAAAGRIQSRNTARGHAHTDLLDGEPPHLDIHIALKIHDDTSDQNPPEGSIRAYTDKRADPPGAATGPFSCMSFTPYQVAALASNQVYINGLIGCTGLPGAYSFELTITDGGSPGVSDGYHMIIYDDSPSVLYDYDGTTTPAYGDLVVRVVPV